MMSTVAERVRWLRETAKLNRRELSLVANLDASHISMIERGLRENLETKTAKSIAAVFNVTLDWLIGGVGDMPEKTDVAMAGRAAAARYRLSVS